ncbi:DNRLRE domain-containing protein [Streptomyces sp. NPDC048142]|uniref:DNRLRE domain-containing protein n=1 Tax=Streptomyces sp. NPDC048142 TaxID=3365501 RepID=UPI00371B65A9
MSAPRLLSPFVRTRTRLTCTLGLLLAALTAALLPWWLPGTDHPATGGGGTAVAKPASTGPRDESAAMAEALRRGKKVLVDTATTATALTWALPNGQWRSRFHALPQRAKDEQGRWAAIDTTLKRTGEADDGLSIRPANAPVPVRFSGGSADGARQGEGRAERSHARLPLLGPADRAPAGEHVLAEVEVGGHTIAYTWPGPLPEPVLDGPRALYSEVLPGVDLLLVAREEGGFGQLLIVKNREAAAQSAVANFLTYGLRSQTAVFRHDERTDGVLVLDADTGDEITAIPTPFGWDSSGKDPETPDATARTAVATTTDVLNLSGLGGIEPGARQSPLATRLDGEGTGSARLRLDIAGSGLLAGEDVRFPVFLDPTIKTGWKAWTTAYKPHPNTSFYNGTNFNSGTSDARVGYEKDTGGTARAFWRMGYSSSLKGAVITSAAFKVLNNYAWSCTKREYELSLTGAISSGTTWNKQPSWRTSQGKRSFAFGYSSSCSDAYVNYSVKNAAQQAADKGWSTLTLGMKAVTESAKDSYTWRKFSAKSAELEVVYNRKPNQPTSGTTSPGGACVPGPGAGRTVAKTNIVLAATATDPDGNLKGLRFRFWKTGAAVPAGTLVTSLSSGRGSLTIPSSSLADKTTYSWDVRSEDSAGTVSTFFPVGTEPCRVTIDASAPPAPDVTSDVFPEATSDGATWATVKFGGTGAITFKASGATKFSYSFQGLNTKEVTASSGTATVSDLKPPHSGPTYLLVYAYDAVGNRSERTDHHFYVPPRDAADGPGDTGGDGRPDLLIVDASGNLRTFPGDVDGEIYGSLAASYTTDGKLNPSGHWYDPATGKAALIAKHSDAYPGDGVTDLFARTPDGGFWLYPGDGYGSFNVDKRLRVRLPSNTPDPAAWDQIKAVGDVTGDKLPELFVRTGTTFWALTGYTGAGFQQATRMNADAWAIREIVNVADIDLDGTPDLLWRNRDNGNMYVRHGKPGTVAGSVNLVSLTTAANSRDGDVPYGNNWTETNISALVGVPDLNGDRIPDMWARFGSDGKTRVYHPSKTNTNGPVKIVLSVDWRTVKAFA